MTRKIPPTMVSQHPDHAGKPYWHDKEFIGTHDETKECYLSFSELGVSEYKWDWEGKLVDESVIERLFQDHYEFFKKNQLGIDKFLTFRLPNPKVETEFRLGRAFISILGAAAFARQIKFHSPPLFEVILPMTETAEEMIAIQEAFKEMAMLKHHLYRLKNCNLKHIEIIPLFEQVSTIMNSDKIIKEYLKIHSQKFNFIPSYIRPYVARSDPALNSGLVPTVIAIKIALSKYLRLEEKMHIKLYPIIGSASLPFRGSLTPDTVESFTNEYRGIKTSLLQSAFRYDYEKTKVIKAIRKLEKILPKNNATYISPLEETELRKLIIFFESYYKDTVEESAEMINNIASLLPKRRERVQHIGLFGYSRGVGKVSLPRAIGFTASLYSMGIPPEIIGTGRGIKRAKKLKMLELIEKHYINLKLDLERAGRFVNKDAIKHLASKNSGWSGILQDILEIEKYLDHELAPITPEEKDHYTTVTKIHRNLKEGSDIKKLICDAAVLRKSLG